MRLLCDHEQDCCYFEKHTQSNRNINLIWWNLGLGEFDRTSLNANLRTMAMTGHALDLLCFGEYTDTCLEPETKEILLSVFAHHFSFAYSEDYPLAKIAVFCREQPEATICRNQALEWNPPFESAPDKAAFRSKWLVRDYEEVISWNRPYVRFLYRHDKQVVNIVPVHLCNPWVVKNTHSTLQRWFELAATPARIVFQAKGPLGYQMCSVLTNLQQDIGSDRDQSPVLLVGDLNIPHSVFGMRPRCLKWFDRHFQALSSKDRTRSFPSRAGRASLGRYYPAMQLDQVFTQGVDHTKCHYQTLSITGSDHYPLHISLRP